MSLAKIGKKLAKKFLDLYKSRDLSPTIKYSEMK